MKITALEIAKAIGGLIDGKADAEVRSFAKIEEAKEGDITFLANPKYIRYASTTKASVILVNNDFERPAELEATIIRVANPYECLAQLIELASQLQGPQHPTGIEEPCAINSNITETEGLYVGAFAYIGKNVTIGKNVKIYPQCFIGEGCEIGDDTVLYPGVKIYRGCKIGARCIVHSGAVIGADGFGFAPDSEGRYHKIQQIGIVEIGDDVEIGANTTVDRATMGRTVIASGAKLDNLVQIAHNVEIGENTVMAAQAGVAGSTKIGKRCMVGGQVGFAGHISVGDDTQVGAQSGIPNNVAPGSRVMGYPAVDAKDFMRNAVRIKRLGLLENEVAQLRKALDQIQNEKK